MITTHFIFQVNAPRAIMKNTDTSTYLFKIADQPIEGYKNRHLAVMQLENLLNTNKPPYAGGNQFTIIETYYK